MQNIVEFILLQDYNKLTTYGIFWVNNFYNLILSDDLEIRVYLNLIQIVYGEFSRINKSLVESMTAVFYPNQIIDRQSCAIQYEIEQTDIFAFENVFESKVKFQGRPLIYNFSFLNPFKYQDQLIFIDISAQLKGPGITIEVSIGDDDKSLDDMILLLNDFSKSETMTTILNSISGGS